MSERRHNFRVVARFPASVLLGFIRVYQRMISPVLPAVFGPTCGCRFAPSCSHYALEAVQTHGAARGAWLTLRRLTKCAPWHAGGIDPVPTAKTPHCTRANSVSGAAHV